MDNQTKNIEFDNIKLLLKTIIFLLIVILAFQIYNTHTTYKSYTRWATKTYDKVMSYTYKKDYDGLLKYSENILEKNADDPNALMGKGIALYYLERFQEAKEMFLILRKEAPYWREYTEGYISSINLKLSEEK